MDESALRAALTGRYAIERELGRGAMGVVYLARDLKHDRSVALKVLRSDVSAAVTAQRFTREIRLTARLQHPNILPLFDSGEAAGLLYYVMPYVSGGTLRDRLAREKQLPVEDAVSIARSVADALSYAHSQNVVHRDIKPENILTSGDQTMVADFGIARAIEAGSEDSITSKGIAVGTPTYMSPEQAVGGSEVDGRSDVYSLGCVLYEMLAGMPPFTGGSDASVIARHIRDPVPPLRTVRPGVLPGLEAVVMKSLAKVPADRYQNASQFRRALSSPTESGTALPVGSRRHTVRLSLVATGVVAVGAALVAWLQVSSARAETAALRSVAVLPCESPGAAEDQAGLGDRWTEELIQKLVKISGLQPRSWSSVERYRDTRLGLADISAQLNARTLIRCSVTETPERVRLSLDIIDAGDGRLIAAEGYERGQGADSINAVQVAAASDIARVLGVRLPEHTAAALERAITRDSAALRLYRVGRHLINQTGPNAFERAGELFRAAIERDSTFAHAYIQLAYGMVLAGESRALAPSEYLPTVARLLRVANSLDPNIAEGHVRLAQNILLSTYDWDGAEEEYRRALALDPSSSDAHLWYGFALATTERFAPAIRELKRAIELDPTNHIAHIWLSRTFILAGDFNAARSAIAEGLAIQDSESLGWNLALLHALRGQNDSAIHILDRYKGQQYYWKAWLYSFAGRRDVGERMLDSLLAVNSVKSVDPLPLALLSASLGKTDEALNWLERAYAERSPLVVWSLGSHPGFRHLRKHPRFQELRRRVGLKA